MEAMGSRLLPSNLVGALVLTSIISCKRSTSTGLSKKGAIPTLEGCNPALCQVHQVHQALRGLQAHKVHGDFLAKQALKAPQAHKVNRS